MPGKRKHHERRLHLLLRITASSAVVKIRYCKISFSEMRPVQAIGLKMIS
jgi:hypothetical protein